MKEKGKARNSQSCLELVKVWNYEKMKLEYDNSSGRARCEKLYAAGELIAISCGRGRRDKLYKMLKEPSLHAYITAPIDLLEI